MMGLAHGLGIDLELDSRDRLTSFGAVLGTAELRKDTPGNPQTALRELDSLAAQADFVFGHNIYSIPITRSILPSITPVAA
jgi:hypothetical protein